MRCSQVSRQSSVWGLDTHHTDVPLQCAHAAFMFYCFCVVVFSVYMIYRVAPRYGRQNPLVYISICSLVGSISVMAIKGFGIAVKLTFAGNNQFTHPSTYTFGIVTCGCIVVQMDYFNKALDAFSTNVYVFTSLRWM